MTSLVGLNPLRTNMSAPKPEPGPEDPQAAFFKVELSLCWTFADIAETHLGNRNAEAATSAIEKAQTGLSTIQGYLNDPKHARHLSEQDRERVDRESKQIRSRLNALRAQISS